MQSPSTADSANSFLNTVIENRFTIGKVLGQGGISKVYEADHQRVDLKVAVKMLHTHFSNTEESIERFKREAAIVNHLNHPNIVHMYSFGVLRGSFSRLDSEGNLVEHPLSDPRPYLVLEHLKGMSLDTILSRVPYLSINDALAIIDSVLVGLGSAHEMGIIHRDIKPSNVMVVESLSDVDRKYHCSLSGELRNVKLLDFGIAKCNCQHDQNPQNLTQPGFIFGSPLYMSPEQCMGQELDPRSDIYSLGCMFYEMLAGKPPLEGENSMHTFAKHLYESPEPLNTFEHLKDIDKTHPHIVETIDKCLLKDRNGRFKDCKEIRSQLVH